LHEISRLYKRRRDDNALPGACQDRKTARSIHRYRATDTAVCATKSKRSIAKHPAASGKSATRKLSATVRLELRVSAAATALEDFAKSPIYVPTITKITAKIYYIVRYDYFYLHYPAIIPQPTNEKTHVFGLKVNIHPTKVNIHGNPNPQFP